MSYNVMKEFLKNNPDFNVNLNSTFNVNFISTKKEIDFENIETGFDVKYKDDCFTLNDIMKENNDYLVVNNGCN